MRAGYKNSNAKNVNVVNTPTVKISHEKPEEHKPTLCLSDKDLPAIKGWKVGSKYKLILEVEQVALRQGSAYSLSDDESKKTTADFKVLNVKEA